MSAGAKPRFRGDDADVSRDPGDMIAGIRVAVLGGAHQQGDDLALPRLDHRDRGRDLAGEPRGPVLLLPVSRADLHQVGDARLDLDGIAGLAEEVGRAGTQGLMAQTALVEARHHHDRHVLEAPDRPRRRDDVEAGHAGHVVVGDDDPDPVDVGPQEVDRRHGAGERHRLAIGHGLQRLHDQQVVHLGIVEDQSEHRVTPTRRTGGEGPAPRPPSSRQPRRARQLTDLLEPRRARRVRAGVPTGARGLVEVDLLDHDRGPLRRDKRGT